MYLGEEFFKEFVSNIILIKFKIPEYNLRFTINSEEDAGYIKIDLMIDNTNFDYSIDCEVMFGNNPILNSIVYPEVEGLDEEAIEIIRNIMSQIRAEFEYTVDFYKTAKLGVVTDATEEDIKNFWED